MASEDHESHPEPEDLQIERQNHLDLRLLVGALEFDWSTP